MTVTITAGTSYEYGIDYSLTAVNVTRPTGTTTNIPVRVVATTSDAAIGFTPAAAHVITNTENFSLGEGHIAPTNSANSTNDGGLPAQRVTGVITVTAYIDASDVAITDTPEESSPWQGTRTVVDTTEWNRLAETPVTFQVRVVADEGAEPTPLTAAQTIAALPALSEIAGAKRYVGANPNNYVSFNNGELWQIIGVYGNNLKIMKATKAEARGWLDGEGSTATWEDTDLEVYLNQETEDGYYYSLSQDAKNMIVAGTWNVGPVADNATASEAYTAAQTTQISRKVGLMATYEYLYSSGAIVMDTTENDGEWFINPSATDTYHYEALCFDDGQGSQIADNYVDSWFNIRPVVYLNQNVTIASGSGTELQPYVLSYTAS